MRFDWNQPPGAPAPSFLARSSKKILSSFLVGLISVGVAWAGVGLAPTSDLLPGEDGTKAKSAVPVAQGEEAVLAESAGEGFDVSAIDAGEVLAGAAKFSMEPRPEDFGGTWETDYEKCATFTPSQSAVTESANHVADFRVRWAENSNCIYMGGYGIGPMNPITSWEDPYGLWVRSIAMNDGQDTLVLTLLDGVYWEAKYNNMCTGCGFQDLQAWGAEKFGADEASFMFASTHSHTAPDFIAGWGGVPQWYMDQITETIKASVTTAIESMRPAILETGETLARARNGERRDFYRSAEDDTFSWFRLIEATDPATEPTPEPTVTAAPAPEPTLPPQCNAPGQADKPECQKPTPTPTPEPTPTTEPEAPTTIATVGAFAAHPVTADEGAGIADADFPAVFAQKVEERFGGIGAFFQTGLGNISPRGNKIEMGEGLASFVPEVGAGRIIATPDIRVAQTRWAQPVTNSALGALGVTGFFDRTMNQAPATLSVGKHSERKCNSASPISVITGVSAAKIGSLWITGGPGELFSNLTNAIEERNPNGVTMPLGLVNDGLGYIIQSFETDHVGRQAVGFVGAPFAEYEDAYSIDHCFGDATLEYTIELLGNL